MPSSRLVCRGEQELHERFVAAREAGEHHPLLLVGCYVFDFLAIHPFRDGNGRMSRLLTILLLYQAGYGVGRYVSIERLVNEARDGYYETLEVSGHGWSARWRRLDAPRPDPGDSKLL